MKNGFAFIQFYTKDSAMQAIAQENKTMMIDKVIAVRTAVKKGNEEQTPGNPNAPSHAAPNPFKVNARPAAPAIGPIPGAVSPSLFKHTKYSNHIEIMAMSREYTEYAENIEKYLKERNLKVDVLYPNANFSMPELLESIKKRGTLFALEVDYHNVKDETVTVYMLYSTTIKWNKNMPVEEALLKVQTNTEAYLKETALSNKALHSNDPSFSNINSITDIEQHLHNLIKGQKLNVTEMDGFIEKCRKMRHALAVIENPNEPKPEPETEIDPAEEALQKKIKNIIDTENYLDKLANPEKFEMTKEKLALLQDPKIERALNALLNPEVFSELDLKFIEKYQNH